MATLSGKVAIVSGGTGFLGQVIVRALLNAGMKVAVLYRHTPVSFEGECTLYQCDLENPNQVKQCFETIKKEMGSIYVCVHAAAEKGERKKITQTDQTAFDTTVKKNISTSFNFVSCAAKTLKEENGGVLIGITTIGVLVPEATTSLAAYTTSKFALQGMLTELYEELKPVRTYSVAPGFMSGGMNADIPQAFVQMLEKKSKTGTLTTPEDVANVIVHLCEKEEQLEMTIPVAREYDMYVSNPDTRAN